MNKSDPTPDLDHFREVLENEAESLQATREELDAAGDTVELDQQRVGRLSRMDAMQMQAMARAEQERARVRAVQLRDALKRIDSGEFGRCLECDEPIALGRLHADPAAAMCIDCAEKAD